MVTTLYIIRHCQSAGNLTGRFQGRFDAPVSEAGEKQLDLLSLRFRNEHLDARMVLCVHFIYKWY